MESKLLDLYHSKVCSRKSEAVHPVSLLKNLLKWVGSLKLRCSAIWIVIQYQTLACAHLKLKSGAQSILTGLSSNIQKLYRDRIHFKRKMIDSILKRTLLFIRRVLFLAMIRYSVPLAESIYVILIQ